MINSRRLRDVARHMTIRDIRLLCQAREALRGQDVATDDFLVTMAIVRRNYIEQVGLKRYISDMLGQYAGRPAINCTAYDAAGRSIVCNAEGKTILEFLMGFTPETLPYRLELQGNKGKRILLAL